MEQQPLRHEFKAVIEGIELPPEVIDGVTRAVQKAVLTELANTDLQGSLTLRIPSAEEPINDDIQGVWVVRERESNTAFQSVGPIHGH